jgi:hypothetical protein
VRQHVDEPRRAGEKRHDGTRRRFRAALLHRLRGDRVCESAGSVSRGIRLVAGRSSPWRAIVCERLTVRQLPRWPAPCAWNL